ncbi:hypothetical protein F5Y09DRAFT_348117 [Xylaria sp. FL1042]|nr:hypothetical protein F5Y09DRAFT_348117 [Xylaria sp. FL1042]
MTYKGPLHLTGRGIGGLPLKDLPLGGLPYARMLPRYKFQSDGNLVLHFSGDISFNSGFSDPSLPCSNPCNCALILHGHNNLYINYGQPNQVVGWSSGTAGVNTKTGTTASYFEVFGNDVAINNFPFVAVIDSKG